MATHPEHLGVRPQHVEHSTVAEAVHDGSAAQTTPDITPPAGKRSRFQHLRALAAAARSDSREQHARTRSTRFISPVRVPRDKMPHHGIYDTNPLATEAVQQAAINALWTREKLNFAPGVHRDGEPTIADLPDFADYKGLRSHLETSGVTQEQYLAAMDRANEHCAYNRLVREVDEDDVLRDAVNAGDGAVRDIILKLMVVLGEHQGYAVTHSELISKGMTDAMLRFMGIPENQWAFVRQGALLHDIGKMVVPTKDILDTPGSHKHNQYEVARRELHGIVGVEIAEEIGAVDAVPYIRAVHQLKPVDVQYNPQPDAVRRFKKRARKRGESAIFPMGRYGRRSDGKTKPNGAVEVILASYPDDELFRLRDDDAEDGIDVHAAAKILVGTYDTISALTDPLRAYLNDSTSKIGTKFTPIEVRDMVVRDFGHNFRELARLRGLNDDAAEQFCLQAVNLMLRTAISHHNEQMEMLARQRREEDRMKERAAQANTGLVFEGKGSLERAAGA